MFLTEGITLAIRSALVLTASGFFVRSLFLAIRLAAALGSSPGYGLFAGMCIVSYFFFFFLGGLPRLRPYVPFPFGMIVSFN